MVVLVINNTRKYTEGRGRDVINTMSRRLLRRAKKNQFQFSADGFERYSWVYIVVTKT
jgi:hypothetical protein